MKIVRVDSSVDDITYGAVEPEGIRLYRGSPFIAWEPTETVVAWDHAKLLSPVIPTKVVGVGRNYADHAAEMDSEVPDVPIIFLKPPTSVIGPLQPVRIPPDSSEVQHEAELAVVIGKFAKDLAVEDVGPYILGYTAANDVTARDIQRSDGQWTRGKGFDTFCPARTRHRHGAGPKRGPVDHLQRQWRPPADRFDERHGVWRWRAGVVRERCDDAFSR